MAAIVVPIRSWSDESEHALRTWVVHIVYDDGHSVAVVRHETTSAEAIEATKGSLAYERANAEIVGYAIDRNML